MTAVPAPDRGHEEEARHTDITIGHRVAKDFRSFEAHEMPLFHFDRDVELVRWTLRCLANPANGWSGDVLNALVKAHKAASS